MNTTNEVTQQVINHRAPAVSRRWWSELLRGVAVAGPTLYAVGLVVAWSQPSAIRAYEYGLWSSISVIGAATLWAWRHQRAPALPLSTNSMLPALVTALALPWAGGAAAVIAWHLCSPLAYHIGWAAAVLAALAIVAVILSGHARAGTNGGRA